jgi:hypothetical protein
MFIVDKHQTHDPTTSETLTDQALILTLKHHDIFGEYPDSQMTENDDVFSD